MEIYVVERFQEENYSFNVYVGMNIMEAFKYLNDFSDVNYTWTYHELSIWKDGKFQRIVGNKKYWEEMNKK